MRLTKEEIKYCNLARAFLNEAYECLLLKNQSGKTYNQKLSNILEVENMMETKEFEIICGASLVSLEWTKIRLQDNIRKLEASLKEEARENIFRSLSECQNKFQKNTLNKTLLCRNLKSDEFFRTCKIAQIDMFEIISAYEDYSLI